MISVESSEDVYKELITILNPKGKRCLENIRMACDFIVSARGLMNYSRVGDIATTQFGGPKKQSIQNNTNLKRYIAARISEYSAKKDVYNRQVKSDSNALSEWPEQNLSTRTRVYIMQLQTRLELVEKRYQELRLQQEHYTKIHPVSMTDVIERGSTNGHLHIPASSIENEELRNSVRSLLTVLDYIKSLQPETINNHTGLVLKRPSGDVVILNPSQFECIKNFIFV